MNLRWAKFSSYIPTHTSTVESSEKVAQILEDFPENEVVYSHSEQIVPKVKSQYYNTAVKTFYDNLSTIFVEGADFDTTWDAMVDEIDYILAGN